MRNNIIVAAISAVVAVIVWEGMHIITGADAPPEPEKIEVCTHKH
jgi:hypothetical protein